MNKIKALFVTLVCITITLSSQAQAHFEQMIVLYNRFDRTLHISMDNGDYKMETIPKGAVKDRYDISAALVRVKQLSADGWELYQNTTMEGGLWFFHLRRPLK